MSVDVGEKRQVQIWMYGDIRNWQNDAVMYSAQLQRFLRWQNGPKMIDGRIFSMCILHVLIILIFLLH